MIDQLTVCLPDGPGRLAAMCGLLGRKGVQIHALMVAETVATFAWFLKWMGYCLPGEPSEEVAAGAPLPRAMAFVFIVLIIMVIVSGPLSASWIG